MSWSVEITHEFEKSTKKLPKETVGRAKNAIKEIAQDPYCGKPLRGNLKGQFSFRIGDYRIIYLLILNKHLIRFLYVRHRKDAYD